jgi:glycosyltransferase involved in cell wall biosynthesis
MVAGSQVDGTVATFPGAWRVRIVSLAMRIGFAIHALDGGGAELVTRRWTEALTAGGHEVCVYTYHPAGSSTLAVEGVAHRHFPWRSVWARWLGLPFWLRRWAGRDRLDVLVAMLTFTNLASLVGMRCLSRSRAALVIVEHNVPTLVMPAEWRRAVATPMGWLARRLFRRADAAIGVSHAVVADLIGGYGVDAARAFVVPNPIIRSEELALDTAAAPTALNVAFVGRVDPQKRPLLFVDALAELLSRGTAVRGIVLGDGSLAEDLRRHGELRGVPLEFRGWREPWWDSAADVDCLLLPSAYEGLGNVFVEAAAARIPSVSCSCALGVADAIVPGLTGELVLGSEPRELADGVLRAVASRGADPLSGWLSRFSVETSTALLLEVLTRATRGSESG